MTTSKTPKYQGRYRLPDPPQREPDELTNYDHLHKTGSSLHLARHFGHPESTLVEADRWIVPYPYYGTSRRRRPDLLVAFNVDPAAYESSNGYIISEQGKPPDFVLEVASPSIAEIDVGDKREDYAALGIPEYWRFDRTESTTALGWLVTVWWTAFTCRCLSRSWRKAPCRATARCWTCICGGSTVSWDGTIRRPDSTSRPTATSVAVRTMNGKHGSEPRTRSAIWKQKSVGCAAPDRLSHPRLVVCRSPPGRLYSQRFPRHRPGGPTYGHGTERNSADAEELGARVLGAGMPADAGTRTGK